MADPVTNTDGPLIDGRGHNSGLLRYRDDAIADHAAVTVDESFAPLQKRIEKSLNQLDAARQAQAEA